MERKHVLVAHLVPSVVYLLLQGVFLLIFGCQGVVLLIPFEVPGQLPDSDLGLASP